MLKFNKLKSLVAVNWLPFKDIAPQPPSVNRRSGERRRRDGSGPRSGWSSRSSGSSYGSGSSSSSSSRRGRGGRGYSRNGGLVPAYSETVPYVNYMPYVVPLEGEELKEAITKQM
jgi:hypothetical protein